MDGFTIWREDCAPICFVYFEDGSMNKSWIRGVISSIFSTVLQNKPLFNKEEITHLQRAQNDEPFIVFINRFDLLTVGDVSGLEAPQTVHCPFDPKNK
ncbi:hypothetical protein PAAG_03606 [Paracoccidioides lutzii Pb01]|uniref:Uncharacterized protein n=1 Tax=Paracoccidioides lutzii (strain ATCC MYA-826 / Pb01) TaxID=502779 RepID=C1GXN2_PARBA|nr:hypothetical protein PAAG_03606 [Paracoccidioides lutzii Pb01]EEH41320.2 hypothetical protein PAAG_03606 [Paracoccidioides lutzii Pb01]